MSDAPAPGATPAGHAHGLERWTGASETDAVIWTAPAGSVAALDVSGDGADAVELQWSVRSAQVPSTRAVVLLEGPGAGDAGADFVRAHTAAEDFAGLMSSRTGVEVGPIEVLVFRPDSGDGPWPEPSPTADGAEFRFRHRGGADIRLTLTIPHQPGEA
ncbi:hypothetical protein [Dietzia sp. CH92]|uniref:hypothetical protein n=1 Tax=Dietzia sp. CH92 TaxID=3051823 RepID=UPI0028D0C774|nr:hypothetical protein [Dietzia sp. CH92]